MAEWYYGADGKQMGPVDREEIQGLLKSGKIPADTLVWNDSFGPEWRKACDVPEVLSPGDATAAAPSGGAGKLRVARAPTAAPSADPHRDKLLRDAEAAGAAKTVNAPQGKGYQCPHCGEAVRRARSSGAGQLFGALGLLLSAAFGGFECPNCGTVPRRDFPADVRTKMMLGTLGLIFAAIVLLVVVIVLLAVFQT